LTLNICQRKHRNENVNEIKYLGVYYDEKLNKPQYILRKAKYQIAQIQNASGLLRTNTPDSSTQLIKITLLI